MKIKFSSAEYGSKSSNTFCNHDANNSGELLCKINAGSFCLRAVLSHPGTTDGYILYVEFFKECKSLNIHAYSFILSLFSAFSFFILLIILSMILLWEGFL